MTKTGIWILVLVVVLAFLGFLAWGGGFGGKTNTENAPSVSDLPIAPAAPAALDSQLPAGTSPATISVDIKNFAFNPASLTVHKGDTVVWKNMDSASHTITGTGGLNSATLASGASYSFQFNTVGNFSYHCNFHPSMIGTVAVTE